MQINDGSHIIINQQFQILKTFCTKSLLLNHSVKKTSPYIFDLQDLFFELRSTALLVYLKYLKDIHPTDVLFHLFWVAFAQRYQLFLGGLAQCHLSFAVHSAFYFQLQV